MIESEYCAFFYEDGMQPEVNHNVFAASIDLGEIHAISSVSENNEGIIITGRKLRRLKRLRNKKLAELQRKMNKCKKGSRHGRSTIVPSDLFYLKPRPNQLKLFIRLAGSL